MKKKQTLKGLRKKAWKVFSVYVRSKGADFQGYQICYSCNQKFLWKEMDAGHYIHNKLDFDEMNIHPQCVGCNKWRNGNLGKYAEHLIDEYGEEAVKAMRLLSHTWRQPNREECLEIIEKYK